MMTVRAVDASQALQHGMRLTGWNTWDLWLASYALGGDLATDQIDAMTAGVLGPTEPQYAALSAAINERCHELGRDHPMKDWNTLPNR